MWKQILLSEVLKELGTDKETFIELWGRVEDSWLEEYTTRWDRYNVKRKLATLRSKSEGINADASTTQANTITDTSSDTQPPQQDTTQNTEQDATQETLNAQNTPQNTRSSLDQNITEQDKQALMVAEEAKRLAERLATHNTQSIPTSVTQSEYQQQPQVNTPTPTPTPTSTSTSTVTSQSSISYNWWAYKVPQELKNKAPTKSLWFTKLNKTTKIPTRVPKARIDQWVSRLSW